VVVHRQRSWREGSWEQLVGTAMSDSACLDLGGIDDRIASDRLPLLRPPDFDELHLRHRPPTVRRLSPAPPVVLWRQRLRCDLVVSGFSWCHGDNSEHRDGVVLVAEDGKLLQAVAVFGNCAKAARTCDTMEGGLPLDLTLWAQAAPSGTRILSAALTPTASSQRKGCRLPLLALGDDTGSVHVWCARTGEPLATCPVVMQCGGVNLLGATSSRGRAGVAGHWHSTCCWVEHICWSVDGSHLAAAAGRTAVLATVKLAVPPGSGMHAVQFTSHRRSVPVLDPAHGSDRAGIGMVMTLRA
jgi:hypothetical protein